LFNFLIQNSDISDLKLIRSQLQNAAYSRSGLLSSATDSTVRERIVPWSIFIWPAHNNATTIYERIQAVG